MSDESKTKRIPSAPLQYFSQDSLNLGYPPKSHSLIYTPPFLIFLILNPK